jgi:glucokinase
MKPFIIGLDIGGTKITGLVFNGRKTVKELTVVTPKKLKGFQNSLKSLLDFLSFKRKIKAVGIGIPGATNDKGMVVYSPNVEYLVGFNLKRFLKSLKYGPVIIENDVNCFALAESFFGQGKKFDSLIGLTLGTGIGGGIIINKKLYRGAHGSAGEPGHTLADFEHDFEYYFQRARNQKDYILIGKLLGKLIANLINLLDPQAIILGGTVAQAKSKIILPAAVREARKYILNPIVRPKVLISNLQNAGALGAALLWHK